MVDSASAGEIPGEPLVPASINVADTTVNQFQSIEVTGLGFNMDDPSVKVHVAQIIVTDPYADPNEPAPPPPFEYSTDNLRVRSDGSIPLGDNVEPDQSFVEIFTNDSWPVANFKVSASYTGTDGQPTVTDPVQVTVAEPEGIPSLSSTDFDNAGQIEQGKSFQITGSGWAADATGSVAISLHRQGQTADVKQYSSNILNILDGVLTGDNTYIVPESTDPGDYSVQLSIVESDDTHISFARFPLSVKDRYVAPPKDPDPVPDPDPIPDPEPPPGPEISTPPVIPPVVDTAPVVRKPAVETPKVDVGVGDEEAKVTTIVKTDATTSDQADPKPVADDESELESLPGLTFDDSADNTIDATLAGAPQTDSMGFTPLLVVIAAMGLLVGGVSVALRKFNT